MVYDYRQSIVISLLHFTSFIYTCSESQTSNRRCRSYKIIYKEQMFRQSQIVHESTSELVLIEILKLLYTFIKYSAISTAKWSAKCTCKYSTTACFLDLRSTRISRLKKIVTKHMKRKTRMRLSWSESSDINWSTSSMQKDYRI